MKCTRCKTYPATSPATGLCSLCLYADEMGQDRAAWQENRALRDAQRIRASRKAKDDAKR